MDKSIYEEALEIIDNNTFEYGKGLDVLKPTYRESIVKALEQAQQQEKLLELQKNIIKQYEILGRTCEYDPADETVRDECYKAIRHWKKELKDLEINENSK